ncbi:MAG: glutaredoxin domain-containing protein [Actinomycetota bacterium]|nr:glutaredoxin domain-containing protein [Actinomycetota bacterium]
MSETETTNAPTITVYWRPGCGFCSTLWSGLELRGIEFESVNIWADTDAAAFVRSVANGNETVPTVSIGDTSLVNPTARQVAELVGATTSD